MYNNLDLNALSIDDIVEEYKLLHERHQQLKERSEEDAQRIHDLKRSLDTALAAERYLTQELEQLGAQAQVACSDVEPRVQQELEELRRKYRSLQSDHEILQQDYDAKVEEMSTVKAKLESTERDLESTATLKDNSTNEEYTARLNVLEQENAELMQKLAEYEETKVKTTFTVAEQEKTIEILKDQVDCLEQNLHCKRDELEEKLQLLESAQEQLVDANAKIAMFTSAPEHNDRKGNSLFAEVDDQRQVMKHLLASQKKSYLDMKKIFNESKFEIHRLKRENIAMHVELQACSTIFCSADKTYQNKLNERIRQLMQQNAKLERHLNVSQERLRELASQKSVTWLDSMLDFCKRETDELKTQLHSLHIQKATLEEQMRNVQQEMARWRFESLKSRCVLIDRENLLLEHKIAFKPVQAMEFNIKEEELKSALPRIVSAAPTPPPPIEKPGSVTTESEVINLDTPMRPPAVCENLKTEVIVLDTPIKNEKLEPMPNIKCVTSSGLMKIKREVDPLEEDHVEPTMMLSAIKNETSPCKSETVQQLELVENSIKEDLFIRPDFGHIKVKSEAQLMSPKSESEEDLTADLQPPAKPLRKGTPIKLKQIKTEISEDEELVPTPVKPQRKGTPVKAKEEPTQTNPISNSLCNGISPIRDATNNNVRSILAKKRDLFAEDIQKNVQFSSKDPIVHNLSPDLCSSTPCSKENANPVAQDIKPAKKTQNIIRRIVVVSKKPANNQN